jgi:SH3-like domain-containing protein
MKYSPLSVGMILLLSCMTTHAFDFKSVGAAPAVLFDAPSQRGKKVYIAPRGMPVEVVLSYGEWSKVRDASGGLAWLETKALVATRNVVVRLANAKIRNAAEDGALIVFSADKNVVLELVEPASSGWAKIKHRDGEIGYVKAVELWGL